MARNRGRGFFWGGSSYANAQYGSETGYISPAKLTLKKVQTEVKVNQKYLVICEVNAIFLCFRKYFYPIIVKKITELDLIFSTAILPLKGNLKGAEFEILMKSFWLIFN